MEVKIDVFYTTKINKNFDCFRIIILYVQRALNLFKKLKKERFGLQFKLF